MTRQLTCPKYKKRLTTMTGNRASRAAHVFMSSTRYFPQSRVGELLKNLESMGRDGQLLGAAENYAELSREVAQLTSSLKELINQNEW